MGSFIKQDKTNAGSGTIRSVSEVKMMAIEVKNKVTIPMYFYRIIVPQLGSYYDNYPVNFDNKIVVCCPLHDEDTPSFRYYEATSSFYCFGCQRGGDIVELHRHFAEKQNGTKPDRDEAIAFLYDFFIKNNEAAEFIDASTQHIQDEKLNSDSQIVKFNIYRYGLEQSITFDSTIKLEVKEKVWELLDKVDLLLSKNLIKTNDAEKYIKSNINKLITFNSSIKKTRDYN